MMLANKEKALLPRGYLDIGVSDHRATTLISMVLFTTVAELGLHCCSYEQELGGQLVVVVTVCSPVPSNKPASHYNGQRVKLRFSATYRHRRLCLAINNFLFQQLKKSVAQGKETTEKKQSHNRKMTALPVA